MMVQCMGKCGRWIDDGTAICSPVCYERVLLKAQTVLTQTTHKPFAEHRGDLIVVYDKIAQARKVVSP
jgi:hypothetical protein